MVGFTGIRGETQEMTAPMTDEEAARALRRMPLHDYFDLTSEADRKIRNNVPFNLLFRADDLDFADTIRGCWIVR